MNYKRVKLLITHQLYTYIALWDVYNHDNKYVIIVESNKHSTNTVVNIVVHYKYSLHQQFTTLLSYKQTICLPS